MKRLYLFIALSYAVTLNAQISPILDHTWTIEQIDTGTQVITADLNPFGDYDTFEPIFVGNFDNLDFYFLTFGHCEGDITFINNSFQFYYHFSGCFLSNDDSSQIALYFNNNFIQQNTNQTTIDNDVSPNVYGPLSYSFTTVGDIVYMDITNSIGEVATFWADTLSTNEFLEQAISIYPNPVGDVINISTLDSVDINILSIYDLQGRKVLNKQFVENQQVNVSELLSGVYILEVTTDKGTLTKKIVKK
jgi:hypothetical protein